MESLRIFFILLAKIPDISTRYQRKSLVLRLSYYLASNMMPDQTWLGTHHTTPTSVQGVGPERSKPDRSGGLGCGEHRESPKAEG